MKDSYGREINYIRISLTDRCNLRCIYCMPEGVELVPREEILREQEILEIAGAAARLGISHVKLTGGEPLVRRCCSSLIREMKQVPGIETVTLTTNGVLLKENLESLKESGIDGINVSLDTADPDLYRKITGGGDVSVVTDAIRASVDAGIRTKINAVALSEENEALLEFARDYPVDVRFIADRIRDTVPADRQPEDTGSHPEGSSGHRERSLKTRIRAGGVLSDPRLQRRGRIHKRHPRQVLRKLQPCKTDIHGIPEDLPVL